MEQRWATSGSVSQLPVLLSLPRQAVTLALPPSAVSSGEPVLLPSAAADTLSSSGRKGSPALVCCLHSPWAALCCLPSTQACSPVGSGCLALPMPAGAAFSPGLSPRSSMLQPYPGICRQGVSRQEPASMALGPPQPELASAGSWRGQTAGCLRRVVGLQQSQSKTLLLFLSPPPPPTLFCPRLPPFPSCFLSLLQL